MTISVGPNQLAPSDLDLYCLQRQGKSEFSRTRLIFQRSSWRRKDANTWSQAAVFLFYYFPWLLYSPVFDPYFRCNSYIYAEANLSGSELFLIKCVNLCQQPGSSNLVGWKIRTRHGIFSSPKLCSGWAVVITFCPPSVRASVRFFKRLLLWSHWASFCSNFIWSLLRLGERKTAKMVAVHWLRWPPCPYMVKRFKIFFRIEDALGLNLRTNHRGREVYQSC